MSATIQQVPTKVPSAGGIEQLVDPGDPWPAPYRGSKYSVRRLARSGERTQYRLVWARQDKLVHTKVPKGLISALRVSRPNLSGSIRITSHGEVLCKRLDDRTGLWNPFYLGKLEAGELEFDGFDLDPSDLSLAQFWRGFHFKHGETWSVWSRPGNNDYLYWSKQGMYFRSTNRYPELCQRLRSIRPRGGRIYITEHGHIWFNLTDKGTSPQFRTKIAEIARKDVELFRSDSSWDTLIDSISERISATKCRPLYLGRMSDFGKPPRTYFEGITFSEGTRNEDEDDEDGPNSSGYRRMRRG
tara:strand:- start:1117 stop:2016 length:900 start_codon:yes stop_codon:yes gene_type:complete